ncbi:MAG: hypothetical protein IT453_03895, partial [Planctomycetes bacterium]|nr:hypothetical protein [Planctomycetota bacterium]
RRTWRRKLAIAIASLVAFFALAEVGLRLAGYPRVGGMRWIADDELQQLPAPFQDAIRGDDEPGREPIRVRINSHSLRGEDFPTAKPAGEKRVLVVGDSLTFGAGVDEDEAFPARLEQSLAAAGAPARVVNAGVNGWACWHYRRWLEARGFELEPDVLVVAVFFGNDMEGPRLLPRIGPAWLENALKRTATFDWLLAVYRDRLWKRMRAWRQGVSVAEVEAELAAYTGGAENARSAEEQLEIWRAQAFPHLEALRDAARARGLPLFVALIPTYVACKAPATPRPYRLWRDALGELGLDCVDLEPLLRPAGDGAWLSWDHGHLNAQGCAEVGAALAKEVLARGGLR